MAEAAQEQKPMEFDRMPGSEPVEEAAAERLDLNFGLGQEPQVEEEDEEGEPVAEVAEEVEEVSAEEAAPEANAEPEEAEEPEEPEDLVAQEPEPEQKKPMVPKSRLDEVLAKQKALQKQLDDLMAAKTQGPDAPEAYDFASKEVEYQNLVLDGEHDKAARLRMEIRTAERAQIEYEMTQKMEQTVSQNQQLSALQQAASDLEANFPVFDRNSGDYNEAYTQEVIDLRDAFIVKGDNPVAALSKAAKFVIREYGLDPVAGDSPTLASPTAPRQVDEVAKKRSEVSRKLKAAQSQPPEMPGESSAARGERAFDVNSMSEDEFNALPEATLKRLRGDVF